MKYFGFKNWKDHQHYSDRRPPWVKWYNNIIEPGSTLFTLPDEMIGQYAKLLSLAANNGNCLPYISELITSDINASSPVNLEEFERLGLIEIHEGRGQLDLREQKRLSKEKQKRNKKNGASKIASKNASNGASTRGERSDSESDSESESDSDANTQRESKEPTDPHSRYSNSNYGISAKQRDYVRSVLRKHNLSIADYLESKSLQEPLTSPMVDDILEVYLLEPDPDTKEKNNLAAKNKEIRRLKNELENQLASSGRSAALVFIDSQNEKLRNALCVHLSQIENVGVVNL